MTSQLVRSFIDQVWNERRLDLLDELVVDEYELRNLSDDSVPVRGRQALREHIEEWLAAFPDIELHETDHLDAGTRVASVTTMTGTHTGGPFQGLDAQGAPIQVTLVAIFTGDGERLLSHGTLLDARRLIEQLIQTRSGAP